MHVPRGADRPAGLAAVEERPPRDVLAFERGDDFILRVTVDADEREGFFVQAFHERPLVGIHRPARRSPIAPEVYDDRLATLVAELVLGGCGQQRVRTARALDEIACPSVFAARSIFATNGGDADAPQACRKPSLEEPFNARGMMAGRPCGIGDNFVQQLETIRFTISLASDFRTGVLAG